MSLSIRLARAGARKRPFYRVVVADSRMPRDGRFIEKIGTYDPLLPDKQQRVRLSTERAQHWMAHGAKPSRRVALFLHDAGAGEKPAIPQQTKKSLPRKKEQEKRAAQQQKSQEEPPAAAPTPPPTQTQEQTATAKPADDAASDTAPDGEKSSGDKADASS